MDANQARAALGLTGVAPVSVEQVEVAYAAASARYRPDGYAVGTTERASLEQWQSVLAEARAALLAEASTAPAPAPAAALPAMPPGVPAPWQAPVPAPARKRLSTGAIVGIVLGSVGTLLVVVAVVVAAVLLAVRAAPAQAGLQTVDPNWSTDYLHQDAETNGFTSAADLDWQNDPDPALCGSQVACWVVDITPVDECVGAQVTYGFSVGGDAPDETRTTGLGYIHAGEPKTFVFDSADDYQYGWIVDFACDPAPPGA